MKKEDVEFMIQQYLDGWSSTQIAEKLSCSSNTVLTHLNKNNIKTSYDQKHLKEYSNVRGAKGVNKLPQKEEILKKFIYDKERGILINKRTMIETKPNKKGYTDIEFYVEKGKRFRSRMHRIIFFLETGEEPDEVDHIDGNPLNNHISNLRASNKYLNGANRPKCCKNATSKYKGVNLPKDKKRWAAKIKVKGKIICLGYFDTEDQAAMAYNKAALEHFGDHAWLNKIEEDINDGN